MSSGSVNIVAQCLEQSPNATELELLGCVSNTIQKGQQTRADDLLNFLFVLSGAMIFFMQAGFAVLCAGAVRIKNVQNTMLKNLLDACGAAVAFFLVGFAFAFGAADDATGTTLIGTSGFAQTGESSAFWFFQYTFSATSVTIVAGTLAERCQMAAYLCYSVFLAGLIYPVVAHSVWSENGFLSHDNTTPLFGTGAIDFAGSAVVHLTGGSIALYATLVLGPRRGRFYDAQGEPLETPKPFPGHSVALQVLGTMILWFGWFGFNGGSALLLDNDHIGTIAANAAASTALAGAGGGVSALFTNLWLEERRTGEPSFNLVMCMNGALSGLVSITGACALVEPWAALLIGIVAGWIYIFSSGFLISQRIDDAVDAVPVHLFNGIWGILSCGLLASPRKLELTYENADHAGWFYSLGRGSFDARLLACQVVLVLFVLGWTFFTMFPFFVWLNYRGWLRADSLEELVGLDISYHGGMTTKSGSGVKREYVDAYNRHKGSLRKRRAGKSNPAPDAWGPSFGDRGDTLSSVNGSDPEINQEAAAHEAFMED